MKLKNLSDVYVYELHTTKQYGETSKKWTFKHKYRLNVQQDINELDRNAAGLINYDIIKIRTDYDVDIVKNDYISLSQLELDNEEYTIAPPQYKVIASPKVGKCTTYKCEIYHGE